MSQSLPTFLHEFPNCRNTLSNKHILFDANVLINVLDDFKATQVLDYLQSLEVTFTIIHPVLVELQNTNSPAKRTQRQLLINNYNFITLPLTKKNLMEREIYKSGFQI